MAEEKLTFGGRELCIHRATLSPEIGAPTVLTSDFWNYVELWLRRRRATSAIFYWQQAKKFYTSSKQLDEISSPLTLYYSFLNAVKALLEFRGVAVSARHGTHGKSVTKKATLAGENVRFGTRGIAAALAAQMGDQDIRTEFTLKQLLYNLVFIHRAFVLTFPKQPEIFVPLSKVGFVQKTGTPDIWLSMEADKKFEERRLLTNLPAGFERGSLINPHVLRTRKRIKWLDGDAASIRRMMNYNNRFRKNIKYIRGQPPTWYLKLSNTDPNIVQKSSLTMMLAAMHRLSELARYDPFRLKALLETQQNWIISEFIGSAPLQFLDEIATELTGQNLAIPFVRATR